MSTDFFDELGKQALIRECPVIWLLLSLRNLCGVLVPCDINLVRLADEIHAISVEHVDNFDALVQRYGRPNQFANHKCPNCGGQYCQGVQLTPMFFVAALANSKHGK